MPVDAALAHLQDCLSWRVARGGVSAKAGRGRAPMLTCSGCRKIKICGLRYELQYQFRRTRRARFRDAGTVPWDNWPHRRPLLGLVRVDWDVAAQTTCERNLDLFCALHSQYNLVHRSK